MASELPSSKGSLGILRSHRVRALFLSGSPHRAPPSWESEVQGGAGLAEVVAHFFPQSPAGPPGSPGKSKVAPVAPWTPRARLAFGLSWLAWLAFGFGLAWVWLALRI